MTFIKNKRDDFSKLFENRSNKKRCDGRTTDDSKLTIVDV